MHNTSTEYKQMHNKTISWNDNWILIFICFLGRLLVEPSASSSSSFIIASFLIQMLRWIRGWVLHIPHRLRDLLWMVRAWSLVAPTFSSRASSSCVFSSQSLLKVITHSSHEWIPWSLEAIQGGYHHFFIIHFFFYCYNLFFDLRDPRKLWLYGLCILDLYIIQLVS